MSSTQDAPEKKNINRYLIDDIENEEHPSDFEAANGYAIFIMRLPHITESGVKVISDAFLISNDRVYIYNRKKKDFDKLGDFSALYEFIDVKIDRVLAKLAKLDIEIAKMEDELYDGKLKKEFANNWLSFKKELVLIERLMEHFLVAFRRFMRHFRDKLDLFAYKDLEEHIERALHLSNNAIKKLDYLYNFYTAKMSDKTNSIISFLTIISGIFLPLTLVTGFFGMNTGGLPFSHDPEGTLKVAIIFLVFEIPFLYILWRLAKRD